MVQLLLAAGADVNAADAAGRTPLHAVFERGCKVLPSDSGAAHQPCKCSSRTWGELQQVVSLLLGAGAAVDTADAAGTTPLMQAARSSCKARDLMLLCMLSAPGVSAAAMRAAAAAASAVPAGMRKHEGASGAKRRADVAAALQLAAAARSTSATGTTVGQFAAAMGALSEGAADAAELTAAAVAAAAQARAAAAAAVTPAQAAAGAEHAGPPALSAQHPPKRAQVGQAGPGPSKRTKGAAAVGVPPQQASTAADRGAGVVLTAAGSSLQSHRAAAAAAGLGDGRPPVQVRADWSKLRVFRVKSSR